MPRKSPKTREITNTIASERIATLLNAAETAMVSGDTSLSLRYSLMARKIQSHYRIRPSLRAKICRKCGVLLLPGYTSSIRLSAKNRYIVVKCLVCGTELHKLYKK